ncbi:hypothetical protein VE25_15405 [Devosia geojensis]|uniref:Phytase-like domain-containing protein n=2 Tax=Devosia geojensis TaxID=443610 RepID=A0A0F5FPZ2_9HYPH|nr:hypothetical protein VE25_15405 [Devosia geojensis]
MTAMRGWPLAGLLLATIAVGGAEAVEIPVQSRQIVTFQGASPGERVGGLTWRGGIEMDSPDDAFGGFSGVAFVSPDQHLVLVSDRGRFASGRLVYDDADRPLALTGVEIEPIRNSKGEPLPNRFSSDAEALDVIHRDGEAVGVRVGFENLTRVADFALTNGRPGGAAREVPIPDWLSQRRTNRSIESVCIAPPASPIAGSTLILTEGVYDDAGDHAGWLLGNRDRGPVSYRGSSGLYPTDCVFLPDGDLLVLERGTAMLSFIMALIRVPAGEVRPDNTMRGEELLRVVGGDIDNMEGIAVHETPGGETRIVLVSDDNFSTWQRNILLEFALPR